jgi:alanine racemase
MSETIADWGSWEEGRPGRFDINLDAIGRATRRVRALVGPGVKIYATLKANAYGFGLVPAARTALAAGADAVAVVEPAAAVALRQAGIKAPILVYAGGLLDAGAVSSIERLDLIPTVMNDSERECLARHVTRPLAVAVKVDAGQDRLGVRAADAAPFIARVWATPGLKLQIVNTHPAVPAEGGEAALAAQYGRFVAVLEACQRAGVEIPVKLFASSKALRMAPATTLNGVDPGAQLFDTVDGRSPFGKLASQLIHIRPDLGYGVVPLGTSDGLDRLHAGAALVRGKRVPLTGRINLEYAKLDIREVPDVAVGDEVVFIGEQRGVRITPEEAVLHQGRGHPSDLAMAVRSSIRRRYLGGDAALALAAAT